MKSLYCGKELIAYIKEPPNNYQFKFEKICPVCGEKFKTNNPRQKYCSKTCWYRTLYKKAKGTNEVFR